MSQHTLPFSQVLQEMAAFLLDISPAATEMKLGTCEQKGCHFVLKDLEQFYFTLKEAMGSLANFQVWSMGS